MQKGSSQGMDKRSQKTQEAIIRAFRELIEERGGISEISVRDIANRANISRSTFYSHYNDIYDLADVIQRHCAEELVQILNTHLQISSRSVPLLDNFQSCITEILTFLSEQDKLSREILLSSRNSNLVQTCIRLLESNSRLFENMDSAHSHQAAIFLVNGCTGMILDWFRTGSGRPIERVSEEILSSITDFSGKLCHMPASEL